TVNGAVRLGFHNGTGTNDYYYAAVNGSVSVLNGFLNVNVAGEVRSNGNVMLSGNASMNLTTAQTGGTGLSMSGSLMVNFDRSTGSTGSVSFGASFVGSVQWFG